MRRKAWSSVSHIASVTVSEVGLHTIRSVYVVRRLLEPYAAARGSLNLTDEDLKNSKKLLTALYRANEERDAAGVRETTTSFA